MSDPRSTRRTRLGPGVVGLAIAAVVGGVAGFGLRGATTDPSPQLAAALAVPVEVPAEVLATTTSADVTTTSAEITTTIEATTTSLDGELRRYTLNGGTVGVLYGDDGDIVVADTELADGFTAESTFVDGVLTVHLRDGQRHSQLTAWCDDHGPQVTLDDH